MKLTLRQAEALELMGYGVYAVMRPSGQWKADFYTDWIDSYSRLVSTKVLQSLRINEYIQIRDVLEDGERYYRRSPLGLRALKEYEEKGRR